MHFFVSFIIYDNHNKANKKKNISKPFKVFKNIHNFVAQHNVNLSFEDVKSD